MKQLACLSVLAAALALSAACAQDEYSEADIPGPAPGENLPHALQASDQNGTLRKLDDLYGDNGVAIVFVRSADWCPYCRRQLAEINDRLGEFTELGLAVVSVSVDEVELITAFADEGSIDYTMLADPDGDINLSLGIRDEQYPVGSAAFGVPRPALYIIDTNGIVRARYMEPTYRTRPDLDQVLAEARELSL